MPSFSFVTIGSKIRLYQQLAMSTHAGIPISVATDRLRTKIPSSGLDQLAVRLGKGEPVAESFEVVGIFSPFECNLIRVGVQTARLEEIFTHLSEYWAREKELGATLISQAIYPMILVHVAIFISGLPGPLLAAEAGKSLPECLIAFIVIIVTNLVWVYSISVPIAVVAIYTWGTDAGQTFWMLWPLIGGALRATYIFRWVKALQLEYAAGIGLPDAVSDAWKASGFVGSYNLAAEAEVLLRQGNPLSVLIRRWPRVPKDWADFVESGEHAGTLETTFDTLSQEAAQSARDAQNRLKTWLPRVIFVIMMVVVGYLMIKALFAFLSPITTLFQH